MDRGEWFKLYMNDTAASFMNTADQYADRVVHVSTIIAGAFKRGNKLLLCGNGNDSSICDVIASRFLSRFPTKSPRPGWPAYSLASMPNFLTGHAERFGQDEGFSRLVGALGQKGDVLMAIESWETSDNVAWALRKAQHLGIQTVALTGASTKLAKIADIVIKVPLKDGSRVSEIHMAIQNAICLLVEKEILGA